jgi:hypothetical protein
LIVRATGEMEAPGGADGEINVLGKNLHVEEGLARVG